MQSWGKGESRVTQSGQNSDRCPDNGADMGDLRIKKRLAFGADSNVVLKGEEGKSQTAGLFFCDYAAFASPPCKKTIG